jgi:tetratricopeptide (TPR) repeat protein
VALGSVLAGAAFAGWATHWFAQRRPAGAGWPLAVAVLLTQGFTQIFYGHVENYSYLAVCLLLFVTLGLDFLAGRRPLWPALLAALAAFAFHILGGLTAVPAAVLVACGWRDRARRPGVIAAVAIALALLLAASLAAAGLYAGESPLARLAGGFQKVVANREDFQAARLLSWRHAANLWSELWLLGPLSVPLLAALLVLLPGARFARGARGAFLLAGTAAYLAPALLTGEGNLGAARNWDLHAAPAAIWAMTGLLLVAETLDPRQARRLLLALLAVSLFHTAPWIALNASFGRTAARVLALPLPPGRGEMMLGTHYLNAGDLPPAERWLRVAVARDSTNVNAQSALGLALARQERLDAAQAPLTAAVRLKPASPQLRADLVTLLLRRAQWRGAAAELRALVTLTPRDHRAWLTLADCHLKLAEPDSAAFVLEAGLGELPGDPEMTGLLGDAYESWVVRHGQRAEWAEARRALELFERRFPGDPRAARLRAALPPAAR